MKNHVTTIEVSPGVVVTVGDLVRYYLEGWRVGYLESVKGFTVKIKPIGPRNGSALRSVTVPTTDVTTP